jgi:hypothetical protein
MCYPTRIQQVVYCLDKCLSPSSFLWRNMYSWLELYDTFWHMYIKVIIKVEYYPTYLLFPCNSKKSGYILWHDAWRPEWSMLVGASLSGIVWTAESHIHDNDLLEHGYNGITSVSDTTRTWTTVLEPLKAVISVRFSRSYRRRAVGQKKES